MLHLAGVLDNSSIGLFVRVSRLASPVLALYRIRRNRFDQSVGVERCAFLAADGDEALRHTKHALTMDLCIRKQPA